MRNLKHILSILAITISIVDFAQQTQLSSLYSQNFVLVNPAETGFKKQTNVSLSYRRQWAGFSGAPSTAWISGHTALNDKMGLGGVVIYDELAFMKNIDAKLYYAYHLKLAADFKLSFGLGLGIIQNSINFSNVKANDYTDEVLTNGNVSGTLFDAQFGGIINFKDLKIGIALPQLIPSKTTIANSNIQADYNLKSHLNLYATYEFKIANSIYLIPTVMYRKSSVSSQIDVIANFVFDNKFILGLGARQGVGVMFNAGLILSDKFQVSYAFEVGNKGMSASGTHEIMLKLKLAKKDKIKDPKPDENEVKEE